jgi:hypothetical protein
MNRHKIMGTVMDEYSYLDFQQEERARSLSPGATAISGGAFSKTAGPKQFGMLTRRQFDTMSQSSLNMNIQDQVQQESEQYYGLKLQTIKEKRKPQ